MSSVTPFLIGLLVLGRTVYALFSGSASTDNKGILREDDPMIYWTVVAIGFVGAAVLFYIALRMSNGG